MITGTLMIDVGVTVKTEEELTTLENAIIAAIKPLAGVDNVEQTDSDVNDEFEEEDAGQE